MEIKVNIEEYLDEDELKAIAKDQFIYMLSAHLKDEKSVERILSNLCYQMVYDKVDEVAGVTMEEYLPKKVEKIIRNLTNFHLFNKPDAWSKETNSGYQILEKTLIDNKDLISQRVVESCKNAPDDFFYELSSEAILHVIKKTFTSGKDE